MPRYDERSGPTRLYVGHISSRTRTRDLEELFSKYGRIRDVDMKQDFAFVDFFDSRDADDARHYLNGRNFDGSRIAVEFAKRGPRGAGGAREYVGRGPTPGTGRCYNCGHDGHWARDCKAGDWKNKCYRCGQRGHIERDCHSSPSRRNRSVSRSRSRSPVAADSYPFPPPPWRRQLPLLVRVINCVESARLLRAPAMAVKKGGRASEVADDETPVPLQAVLLADSFAQKFRPITLERPKVLLPLINIPMIDYTLEWLASAGVEEVFVFCCAHAKQVTNYLDNSAWQTQPNFKIVHIESHDCVSVGEALRLIDQRNVVRGDFVLITGDTVSNMSLKEALQEHKERRKSDKLSVMTMVVKRSKPSRVTHQTRLGNDELLLAIDPQTKELLHYDDGPSSNPKRTRQVVVDRTLYLNKPSVCLCTDLQDCYIDICSPEVLVLFTDNFDYQHLRRDFVKGILSDEISGNKIFTYEICGEYAARIDNLRSYDSVSKDIIHRWTYPIVPDIRFAGNNVGLKIERCNVYRENGVLLPRSAKIGPSTVLGEGTSVNENCVISNSVIGRNCVIGRNVTIEGSYVWNNVTIHDNAYIQSAVICDGCVVKAGARIEPGAVLSFGVVIGPNFSVPSYSKISLIAQPTEEDSSDEELEYVEAASGTTESPQKVNEVGQEPSDGLGLGLQIEDDSQWEELEVGASGKGFRWSMKDASNDEEWRYSVASIPADKVEDMRFKEEQADLDDADQDAGVTAGAEEEEDEVDAAIKKKRDFEKEAEETFRRLFLDGVPESNVILEMKALRLGFNLESSDCAAACFKSIINLALEEPFNKDSELFVIARRLFGKWKAILDHHLTSEDDQVEVLLKFEEICLESGKAFAPIFCPVLRVLYDQETISEDAILSWASEKQDAEEGDKIFLKQCEPFIKWLEEASEEDDEDEA